MINSFKQRASTFEFCQVCNVNKVLINMNNELEDEWLPLNSPRGFAQVWDYDTFLIYITFF